MKKYNHVCNFNLDDCMRTLGLDEMGRVQQVVTGEFQKNVQPFVPFDEVSVYEQSGRLKDSARLESSERDGKKKKHEHMRDISQIENGTDVVWDTPYARRLYYHPEYHFQGAPMRGGYWAVRYLQNGGQEQIEQAARDEVKK